MRDHHNGQFLLIFCALGLAFAGLFLVTSPLTEENFSRVQHHPINIDNAIVNIDGEEIALSGGFSDVALSNPEDASTHVVTTLTPFVARGDINHDGAQDAIGIVTQTTGGSGVFFYVVPVVRTLNGTQSGAAHLVGDRVKIQNIVIKENIITVYYLDRSQDEPFSTPPSVAKTLHFTFTDGALVLVE